MRASLALVLLAVIASHGCVADDGAAPPCWTDVVTFGGATFSGSGCQDGDGVEFVQLGAHGVKVAFDTPFVAAATSCARVRSTCNAVVPLTVNDGFQVGITRELFKGHVTIPEAEKVGARFTSEYFFAGGVGPKTKHLEKTPTDNDFVADDGAADTVWSECGATTLFRVNAALIAHGDGASISLYTCDASDDHGLAFNVSVRACDSIERK